VRDDRSNVILPYGGHKHAAACVAATNRDPTELRLDVAARFVLQVAIPGLDDRREDIPALVRHLLLAAATGSRALRSRFFAETSGGPEPR
jgi:DNA-binding NtrC family response regulator